MAGLFAGVGRHGKQRLAVEAHFAIGKYGVVVHRSAAIVVAGNVGGNDHRAHAGGRAHRRKVEGHDAPVGDAGQAGGRVQGASGLGDVVGVGGLARDVQMGAFVGQGGPDGRRGGVHVCASSPQRLTGTPLASSHRRCSSLAATCRR